MTKKFIFARCLPKLDMEEGTGTEMSSLKPQTGRCILLTLAMWQDTHWPEWPLVLSWCPCSGQETLWHVTGLINNMREKSWSLSQHLLFVSWSCTQLTRDLKINLHQACDRLWVCFFVLVWGTNAHYFRCSKNISHFTLKNTGRCRKRVRKIMPLLASSVWNKED